MRRGLLRARCPRLVLCGIAAKGVHSSGGYGEGLDSASSEKSTSSSDAAPGYANGTADDAPPYLGEEDSAEGSDDACTKEVIRINDSSCAICDDGGECPLWVRAAHENTSGKHTIYRVAPDIALSALISIPSQY